MARKTLALLAAVLVFGSGAAARTTDPTLNTLAQDMAGRSDVTVRCYEPAENGSPMTIGAWGYVKLPLARANKAHLDITICEGALGVNDPEQPAWKRALGVLVLVHESWHLRRWHYADNEAKTECQAIRHWRMGARMLGATNETIEELWPSALAAHYELANWKDWWTGERAYYDPRCVVPPLITDI